jgi:hypothetical protein
MVPEGCSFLPAGRSLMAPNGDSLQTVTETVRPEW